MKKRKQFFYRGSICSCNYSCSYCPFCKHRSSPRELLRDEEELSRFTDRLFEYLDAAGREKLFCAVQIVPYGEALVHPYYWRELARLSRHPRIEYVGAQSNLSFPVGQMLAEYERYGGERQKLRLWGTFHPQMVSLEAFAGQCMQLGEAGVSLCVGTVGVPEQIEIIRQLRRRLPPQIYVWVNRMDGLGRGYTDEERAAFLSVDEYFMLENRQLAADYTRCADNVFVEADGTMHPCNLSRFCKGNFYEEPSGGEAFLQNTENHDDDGRETEDGRSRSCGRKTCSCYLAYSNRRLPELLFFGPYPAFRIPVYPKAVFLDVDGTLTDESGKIPPERIAQCRSLAGHCAIYLATSLPLPDARRRADGIWEMISGGVFANGAVLRVHRDGKEWERIHALHSGKFSEICREIEKRGGRVYQYRIQDTCYKITVCAKNGTALRRYLEQTAWPENCQILWEGEYLQITAEGTGKLAGVRDICEEMGYGRDEVFVAGDSENDISILEFYPFSAKVLSDGWEVKYP